MTRIYAFLAVLILLTVSLPGKAQDKLKKRKIGDHVTMKIPESFIPMSERDMWQRVSSYRKALALYTDMDRLVELGVNHSFSIWEDGDYATMKDVYKASILELYDNVEFMKEELMIINKRTFLVFEFVSSVKADETDLTLRRPVEKYTYIQFSVFDGETYVFNFSAAKRLREKGTSVGVINMHTVKPIDKKAVVEAARHAGAIVTAEEHQLNGGLGSAIAEVLGENIPVPMERVAILDTFGESGEPNVLMDHYHLGIDDVVRAVLNVKERKHAG